MALTFDVSRKHGVRIFGSEQELDDLRDTIAMAIEDGEAEGTLLNKKGVSPVLVRVK